MATVKKTIRKFSGTILPAHSRRRRYASKALKSVRKRTKMAATYEEYIKNVEPELFSGKVINTFTATPLISIIVPCYNTPKQYIVPLIEGVLNQAYDNWQLILADGSTDSKYANLIKKLSLKDNRITYSKLKENKGIVGNTNEGLKLAKGEYIAFHDHDDVLSPYALQEVVIAINKHNKPDLIYSDEDKLSDDGKERLLPFFKPDWSPDLLLGVNYITHLVVAKKEIVDKIHGLRPGFDGAQDYDFLLRFTEQTDNIVHIPKMLYHWRQAKGSTAIVPGQKNYADTAGRRALADAVKRRGIKADVLEIADRPTNYRLKYKLPAKQPQVSIVIPFRDKPELLEQCVTSILDKTTYRNYELILVSNESKEQKTHELLAEYNKNKKCRVFYWDHSFNYAAINNFGVSKATGSYVVLLNNDTEVITPEWLEELIGVASQPGVGAVGALLLYPESKNGIQHAGVVLGMGSMAGHVFRHRQPDEWTDFGLTTWPRNYLAVTGACLVVESKKYKQVGGLDEKFIVSGNDVAFCLRLHEKGYKNIYWPFARLFHYESVSVKSYSGIQSDYDYSLTYYKPYHEKGDTYFNQNLDIMNEQVSVRGK